MTIPNLIIEYRKSQTEQRVKKVYSTFMQVNQLSSIDNGPVKNWFTTETKVTNAKLFAETYVTPYFGVVKTKTT